MDGATSNWVSVPIPAGTPITTIAPTSASGQGGDFINLFQAGFFTTAGGTLVSIVAALGTAFPIAPITGLNPGQSIVGMGYDLSSATMYLATLNPGVPPTPQLYTLNIGTAVATFVGNVTNAPGLLAIAVSCNGDIYGIDTAGDNLVRINATTAEGTIVGPLNVEALAVAQDADFDPPTGILYWTHFNGASGELRSVDVNTGNSTLISTWSAVLVSFGIFGDCPPTGVGQGSNAVPLEYELSQNYPNPFNPTTTISFSIPQSGLVSLKIYNVLGRELAELVNEVVSAGRYQYQWDAAGYSSGTYYYKIAAGEFFETKKLLLIK
ncbi:MAG: T9SS type A sorting domain-containing protein [Ignavibacteria bacterium]|nr:T9SS type A sorting domain-containing protein [Ignavibacteria bacterium]